ncbi:uncharacterized protein LOC108744147 isoform X2 [Agrilus planipennis]|uniref:Uncharacterized protein LOC108744147 isoform X2 n=1 Tax=Agrilus planipennis TaxID=224129 RepID=A0A1W4XR66_AGRPL|nr:uncharacterized protein LOC108744147 isoform X2 [Agrilus planipennis]
MCEEESTNSSENLMKPKISDSEFKFEIFIPQKDIFGMYQKSALELEEWINDAKKPSVRFNSSFNARANDLEQRGILTYSMIADNSSFIERGPIKRKFVRCKCVLSGKLLKNIDVLSFHHYLSYLDLSWNKLKNLSPLGELPCLMYLDVSHNLLERAFNFKAPHNLIYANFSHNNIKKCVRIFNFWSLVEVDLSHNFIKEINRGFLQLKFLKKLDMSYNLLAVVKHLEKLKIVSLDLEHNNIIYNIQDEFAASEPSEAVDEKWREEEEHEYSENEYGEETSEELDLSTFEEVWGESDHEEEEDEEEEDEEEREQEIKTEIDITDGSLLQVIFTRKKHRRLPNLQGSQTRLNTETSYQSVPDKVIAAAFNSSVLPMLNRAFGGRKKVKKKLSMPLNFQFNTLERLTFVNLANNELKRLGIFKNAFNLEKIVVSQNQISDLSEVRNLEGLRFLLELDLQHNPICSNKYYHKVILHSVPHLRILDGVPVEIVKKVATDEKFKPNLELQAAERFAKLQIITQFTNPPITAILPVSQPPPPLIVLVGLFGCRHDILANIFYENNKRLLEMATTYTTNPRNSIEATFCRQEVIVSVEKFDEMVREGRLITVSEEIGFDIGISSRGLDQVYDKAFLLYTDLVNALTLRFRCLRPTLILALPETEELHITWLCKPRKSDIANLTDKAHKLSLPTDEFWDHGEEGPTYENYENQYQPNASMFGNGEFDEKCAEDEQTECPLFFLSPATLTEDDQNEVTNEERSIYKDEFYSTLDTSNPNEFTIEEETEKIEENSTKLNKFCIKKILQTRREYLEFHEENPGVIEEVVFTNRLDQSCEILDNVLLKRLADQRKQRPVYDLTKDPCYKTMTDHKLRILSTETMKFDF